MLQIDMNINIKSHRLICIFILLCLSTNEIVESGSLDRWFGGLSATEPIKEKPPEVKGNLSIFQRIKNQMTSISSYALHSMGTILPLRGFASFAADLGIPGAATMLDILTHFARQRDCLLLMQVLQSISS